MDTLLSESVRQHMELAQKLAKQEKAGKIDYSDPALKRLLALLYIATTPERQITVMTKIIEYLDNKKSEQSEPSTNNT